MPPFNPFGTRTTPARSQTPSRAPTTPTPRRLDALHSSTITGAHVMSQLPLLSLSRPARVCNKVGRIFRFWSILHSIGWLDWRYQPPMLGHRSGHAFRSLMAGSLHAGSAIPAARALEKAKLLVRLATVAARAPTTMDVSNVDVTLTENHRGAEQSKIGETASCNGRREDSRRSCSLAFEQAGARVPRGPACVMFKGHA